MLLTKSQLEKADIWKTHKQLPQYKGSDQLWLIMLWMIIAQMKWIVQMK